MVQWVEGRSNISQSVFLMDAVKFFSNLETKGGDCNILTFAVQHINNL